MALSKTFLMALAIAATGVQANSDVEFTISCMNNESEHTTTVGEPFFGSSGCTSVFPSPYTDFQIKSVSIDDNEQCYVSVYDFQDKDCTRNTISRVGPFRKGQNGLPCANLGTDPITGANKNGGNVRVNCEKI